MAGLGLKKEGMSGEARVGAGEDLGRKTMDKIIISKIKPIIIHCFLERDLNMVINCSIGYLHEQPGIRLQGLVVLSILRKLLTGGTLLLWIMPKWRWAAVESPVLPMEPNKVFNPTFWPVRTLAQSAKWA